MNEKIVVVDDDPAIQRPMEKTLLFHGYTPLFCRKAVRAPLMVHRVQPTLVIVDAHLGAGMNGFQLCAILKKSPTTHHIPVMMISGRWVGDEFADQARGYGADAYVGKSRLWPELTRFLLQLRVAHASFALNPRVAVHELDLRPRGTVLVVDDEEGWRQLTAAWLTEAGHKVLTTGSAGVLTDLVLAQRPDCVVLDYDLGCQRAEDVCRRLQEHALSRAVPVVILTAHKAGRVALASGADLYVAKDGENPQPLVESVCGAIRRYRWSTGVLVKDDVTLDPRDKSIFFGGRATKLSDEQFKLLYELVSRSPFCVSRAELFARVLGRTGEQGESRALDILVVRTKARLHQALAGRIHHFREVGWTYELPAPTMPLAPRQS